jgi:hypothetical protein
MSEVNNAPVWYPPSFPEQGRLPSAASLTGKNSHQQDSPIKHVSPDSLIYGK